MAFNFLDPFLCYYVNLRIPKNMEIMAADKETALRYAIEEAFAGDFTSLKERFRLTGTQLFEPTSLEVLMDLRKELLQQFRDEVIKRVL